jgi:hypothetical protein
MREPKDIHIMVTDTFGKTMVVEVHCDSTIDRMAEIFKTILVYLGYSVDKLVINSEEEI